MQLHMQWLHQGAHLICCTISLLFILFLVASQQNVVASPSLLFLFLFLFPLGNSGSVAYCFTYAVLHVVRSPSYSVCLWLQKVKGDRANKKGWIRITAELYLVSVLLVAFYFLSSLDQYVTYSMLYNSTPPAIIVVFFFADPSLICDCGFCCIVLVAAGN